MTLFGQHLKGSWMDRSSGASSSIPDDEDIAYPYRAARLDWAELWADKSPTVDWLCQPLLARRRSHAFAALGKAGKSLIMQEMVGALTTGRAVLSQPAGEPITVVYVDLEMDYIDVRDRLADFGYSDTDDLSRLHYVSHPRIRPLDTYRGGAALAAFCEEVAAELVVIDTLAVAAEGPEDSSDTYRNFARCTGELLKSSGITVARLDHVGQNAQRGQRGSTAKNDDVDVVWQMTSRQRTENSAILKLESTHHRMNWIPDQVNIFMHPTDGVLAHEVVGVTGKTHGDPVMAAMQTLDDLQVPALATERTARDALKAAGKSMAADTLRQALRRRKSA